MKIGEERKNLREGRRQWTRLEVSSNREIAIWKRKKIRNKK